MSGMELRQNLKLSQQLTMTPQLQLAIKMLALNNIELSDIIKQEILENPILDTEFEDLKNEDEAGNESYKSDEQLVSDNYIESESGFNEIAQYLVNYNEQFVDLSRNEGILGAGDNNYLEYKLESSFYRGETLYEHVMEQVRTGNFSKDEIILAEYIAGNLNSKGFLAVSREDLEYFAKKNISSDIDDMFVADTLYKINILEPVGLAADNAISSLAIQADFYFKGDSLLKDIINKHLKEVAGKNYQKISKETGAGLKEVLLSIENLKKLNPNPAANFGKEAPRYIVPDLFLKKENDSYIVYMQDDYIPEIKINPYYKKVVSGEIQVSADLKNYAEERFKSALWLMKSISTRKETILNIAQRIVDKQHDYFDKTNGALKPLILKDISEELNIHESTVSRATANKYLSTHLGVFELKSFFTGASYGESSSDNVMAMIKSIINSEYSAGKVYKDVEIADILNKQGINIARRTIAKYRDIMNIPPSSTRLKNII